MKHFLAGTLLLSSSAGPASAFQQNQCHHSYRKFVSGIPSLWFDKGTGRSSYTTIVANAAPDTNTAATEAESAVTATTAPATASQKIPELPPDALILTSSDKITWELEKKEYRTLAENPEGDAPTSFSPLLASFEMKGRYYHAFESQGLPFRSTDMGAEVFSKDDGSGQALPYMVSDAVRVALIKDLVEAVSWCHLQGVPHLMLDGKSVRLYKTNPELGKKRGFWRLSVVGIGAGPQLISKTSPYQVGNASFAFNPPETLSGALIKGNLPGLFAWDSWTAGVIITMICGGYNTSPFFSEVGGVPVICPAPPNPLRGNFLRHRKILPPSLCWESSALVWNLTDAPVQLNFHFVCLFIN